MKKILILGAGGFLGTHLVNKLCQNNYIVAFDICPMFFNSNKNIEIVVGSFKNESLLADVLCNVDIVIHLISTTFPSDSTEIISSEILDNVIPTVNLLNLMKDNGVGEIIFASSGGTIYGETAETIAGVNYILNPSCSYGIQKQTIESYIKLFGKYFGMKYKIMRISNPYGLGQGVKKKQGIIPIAINKLISNDIIEIFGDGSNLRDYIYIDDLINAFQAVVSYSGEESVFNIGYGHYYSISEIIEIIEKTVGKQFAKIVYRPQRLCDVKKSILDFATSQRILKWKPQIDINIGISEIYKTMNREISAVL